MTDIEIKEEIARACKYDRSYTRALAILVFVLVIFSILFARVYFIDKMHEESMKTFAKIEKTSMVTGTKIDDVLNQLTSKMNKEAIRVNTQIQEASDHFYNLLKISMGDPETKTKAITKADSVTKVDDFTYLLMASCAFYQKAESNPELTFIDKDEILEIMKKLIEYKQMMKN